MYHISPAENRDSIDRLGILSRNDIRFGTKFHYPPAVFANNTDALNNFFWWPFFEEMWDYEDTGMLDWLYDIWEIDTRIVKTTWYQDFGLLIDGKHIFTLDDST